MFQLSCCAIFADSDGFVWWWSKDLSGSQLKKGKPEVVFRRRDLNARVLDDGTLDQEAEREMQVFDDNIAPFVDKLISQGRNERPPSLTPNEKELVNHFMYVQFKRSPEWRTENMERDVYRDLTGGDLPKNVPPKIRASSDASVSSKARRILQNDFAESLPLEDKEVARVLREKGLLLCRAPQNTALVLGTTGVVSAGAAAGSLREAHRGLAIPLASDIFLYVGKSKDNREYRTLSAEQVQSINRQVAKHSYGIAGRSSELLRCTLFSR